jgi:AcrR family transcriptional regulator
MAMAVKRKKVGSVKSAKKTQVKAPEHSSEKLLKAALVVFARDGFHGATTKGIANEAGVNEALIIRHFQNKEGLFLAVVNENIVRAKQNISYPIQDSVENELLALSKHFISTINNNKDFYKILFAHNIQNPEFKKQMQSSALPWKRLITERLAVLAKKEGLTEFDYGKMEGIVINLSYMSATYSAIFDYMDVESASGNVRETIRFIWRGLRPNYVKPLKKRLKRP